jgi:TonB family protein
MIAISARLLAVLFNSLWQIALIAATAAVCVQLLRRATAGARHLVWVCALVTPLILAAVALRPNTAAPHMVPVAPEETPVYKPVQAVASGAIANWHSVGQVKVLRILPEPKGLSIPRHVAELLLAIYLLVLAFRAVRFAHAWRRTRAIIRSGREVELTAPIRAALEKCQATLGARAEIRASDQVASPVTAGTLRPIIILPERMFAETDEDLLISSIGHELAHVRRYDYAMNLLYEILYAPLAFHPAAAWVRGRIRQTRELRCDELVTEKLVTASAYAGALVKMAEWSPAISHSPTTISLGIVDAGNLEERVMSLLQSSRARTRRRLAVTLAALVLFAIPCIAIAPHAFHVSIAPDSPAAQQTQDHVYTAGSDGVTMPTVISAPKPSYTKEALDKQIQGVVILRATIDAKGAVQGVSVVKSLEPSLDESAMQTVRGWHLGPATKDGKPVACTTPIQILFSLPVSSVRISQATVSVRVGSADDDSSDADVASEELAKQQRAADKDEKASEKAELEAQLAAERAAEKVELQATQDSDHAKLQAEQQATLDALKEKLAEAHDNGAPPDELRALESQLDLLKLQANRSDRLQQDVAARIAELAVTLTRAEEALKDAQDQHEATDDVQQLKAQLESLQAQLQYMQKYQRGVAIKDEDGKEMATLENSKLWSKFEQGSSQQQLAKLAKLSMSQAIETANAQQPGSVVNCELLGDPGAVTSRQNPETGAIYYTVSIVWQNGDTTMRRTIFVDAITGKIFDRK